MSKKALPVISVKKAYFGPRKKDATTAPFYEKPSYLENVTEVGYEKNYGSAPFYAEGELKISNSVLSDIPLTVALGDLTVANECLIMGHKESSTGGVVRSTQDVAPEGAFIFIEETADHQFEVTTLYSGTFTPGGKTSSTSAGSPNYQTKTITAAYKPVDIGTSLGLIDNSEIFETLALAMTYCETVVIPALKTSSFAVENEKNVKKNEVSEESKK